MSEETITLKDGESVSREVEVILDFNTGKVETIFKKWRKIVDEEQTIDLLTAGALESAKEAFGRYMSDRGYDSAFWDIRFTAWRKDSTLSQRLQRYEIEDECK
jgi:hypothetical protein